MACNLINWLPPCAKINNILFGIKDYGITPTDSPSPYMHTSVMMKEVLEYLCTKPGSTYIDVTFGAGGHTSAILDQDPTCKVIAIDWDRYAIETYGPPLKEKYGDRLHIVWGNFGLLYKIIKKEKIPPVDGILADFGTSQVQIQRLPGMSFSRDTFLDMRMSPAHQLMTAADVLAKSSEKKLVEIFTQLGEEQKARAVAQAIIRQRTKRPITTTKQLADLVQTVIPPHVRKVHSATKIFQALRLYVNHELNNIESFLPAAIAALKPKGVLVCISFHSLEDRIVKQVFKDQENLGTIQILTQKVVTPTEEEITINPSSRSAKLRAAIRLN